MMIEVHVKMDYIEFDSDWGYYVDPETFDLPRVRGEVPIGSVVLTKERETLDTGITVVVTNYWIAKDGGLKELDGKREASEILAKQMLQFMKSNGSYPPGVEKKKEYSNGNVDLEYVASDYDKFTIKMTSELVGGNVLDFLDTLEDAGRRKFNPTDSWRIETAKSSRASCRTCGAKIEKGKLRFGEPSYFQDHLSWKWHHFECISDELWGIPKEKLEGYEDLGNQEKAEVKKSLWE